MGSVSIQLGQRLDEPEPPVHGARLRARALRAASLRADADADRSASALAAHAAELCDGRTAIRR